MPNQNQIADYLIQLNKCESISEFAKVLSRIFEISKYAVYISDLEHKIVSLQATSIKFDSEIEFKEIEAKLSTVVSKEESILSVVNWSFLFDTNAYHYQITKGMLSYDLIMLFDDEAKQRFELFLPYLEPFAGRFIDIYSLEGKLTNKSEFLRKAVHDLKNPLSNIIGYLSLLNKYIEIGDLDPVKMKDDVKHIIRIAEHMTKLVTDLLTIASFESGKINLGLTNVNVFKLIHESLAKVERIGQKKNVVIKKSISTIETDIYAAIDGLRVATAINELINHALKFTFDGEIEFIATLDENNLIITVTDHVHDISSVNINDLFTGFASLQTRTTDGQKPNSFTLLLIKKIVETHHGEVFASANMDGGASFSIKIPLNQPNA